jgi:hypothetical protein
MHHDCSLEATRILVDYNHEIIGEGELYCEEHAFKEGRENCPCCSGDDSLEYEYIDDELEETVELLLTYPQGTLDKEGCCSIHP